MISQPHPTPTALVIDDEPVFRTFTEQCLKRLGLETTTGRNGYDALRALETMSVDLILTDVFMPDCDGIELIRTLRGNGCATPIIAVSGGYGMLNLLQATRVFGASATLRKPFTIEELTAVVQVTLGDKTAGDRPGGDLSTSLLKRGDTSDSTWLIDISRCGTHQTLRIDAAQYSSPNQYHLYIDNTYNTPDQYPLVIIVVTNNSSYQIKNQKLLHHYYYPSVILSEDIL